MAAGRVRLFGAWSELEKAIDPRDFRKRLDRELAKSFQRIGAKFVGVARAAITAEKYAPNSPITVILKGSSKPLVDRGTLYQGITYQVGLDARSVRLGVVRQRSGAEVVDLALILHEGATIDVRRHPQVARKVWAMVGEALRASGALTARRRGAVRRAAELLGGGGGSRGGVWVIPPRRFLAEPLASDEFLGYARQELARAARAALIGR